MNAIALKNVSRPNNNDNDDFLENAQPADTGSSACYMSYWCDYVYRMCKTIALKNVSRPDDNDNNDLFGKRPTGGYRSPAWYMSDWCDYLYRM